MSFVRIPQLTPAIGIDGTEEVEIAVLISPGNYESRRTTTGAIAGAGLPSGVTPGTYGDSTHVGQFTVDVFGKLTAAQNVVIGSGGIGTVTSVAMTVPTGLSVTGSPITTNGTLAVTWTSGTTGTGANVFATSPTLVTPNLGTPSAAILTNATGLPISSGVSGLGTGVATFLGTPSSANLAAAVTDETGTGSLVFATNPVLVTPNLGTPSAGVLTNATGLPIVAGTTGTLTETRGGTNQTTYATGDLLYASGANTLAKRAIGTSGDVLTVSGGVPTWVAPGSGGTVTSVSVVTANGFAGSVASPTATPAITVSTTVTGILQGNGTAISAASTTGSGNVVLATGPVIDLTNATGLPIAGITGLGSGVGTWLATPSSANLAAAVTDETGSGALVFANTPTLVTPVLGVATATSINKVAITAPATSATLTIPDGVTMTGPPTSGTVMTIGNAETVTGAKTFNNNKLLFAGSSSGVISVQTQAVAGTYNWNLPIDAGTTGQPLLSGGGGSTAMTFGTLGISGGGTGGTTIITALVNLGFLGAVIDFAGSTAPTGWLLCYGQNISRTTYAALFSLIGTTYGTGDGSTTFGMPDLRGRVVAGKDNMGGSAANRITTGGQAAIDGSALGSAGGSQDNTLDTTRIPSHTHTVTDPGHVHTFNILATNTGTNTSPSVGNNPTATTGTTSSNTTGITNQNAGGGGAHNNVQPTFILNKIMFVGA